MKKVFLIFTCEHASNSVPEKYQKHFIGKKSILASHRGFDWGTEHLGKILGKTFNAPVIFGTFSRLLIDLNRSEGHKTALSEMTMHLGKTEHEIIKETYHRPHWRKVRSLIEEQIKKGNSVIHIGIHSFTPSLHGVVRTTDLGLCYDSRRKSELKLALEWQKSLRSHSDLRIRRNYPYSGQYDGLTSSFRKDFSDKLYRGFEIEINQALVIKERDLKMIESLIVKSLKDIL